MNGGAEGECRQRNGFSAIRAWHVAIKLVKLDRHARRYDGPLDLLI
jgi:hypothetical protein